MIVDMSPRAITTRLKRVAQLRATYLQLSQGKLVERSSSKTPAPEEPPSGAVKKPS